MTWLVVVPAGPAAAETGAALLRRGVEQYQLAGFQEASRSLLACLASTDLTATQRARAHAYLGLIQLARGETDRARQSFGRAKAADRDYTPDPNRFSPQALRLFHQAPCRLRLSRGRDQAAARPAGSARLRPGVRGGRCQ